MDAVKIATYTYDASTRLASVTDPRSNLTTTYTYDATSNRLQSIKPPGMDPYTLEYTGSDTKLARVKRARPSGDPTGGTATLSTVLYNVPVTGNSALPSLSSSTVQTWGQTQTPTYAAAVFGPDKPVSTLDPTQVPAADWPYADLSYTDARGYTINTAEKGAGRWQLTSTTYDDNGNLTRQLDTGDVNAVTSGQIGASDAGTTTIYNAQQIVGGNVVLPAGSVVTDTYGMVRQAVIGDGSLAWIRPHSHTDYDQSAPNGSIVNSVTQQAYALPTTETVTANDPATGIALQALSTTRFGYDPIVTGDPSGWTLGKPTSQTTVMGGSATDIVSKTRYDAASRIVETRQPNSNGVDAGTQRTSYHQATGTATSINRDGRPQWAGLPCVTDHAAAPSSGPTLPTSRVDSYSMLLDPSTTKETSGSVVRTTKTSSLPDGRPETVDTTLTPP